MPDIDPQLVADEPTEKRHLDLIENPDHRNFYANFVAFQATNMDVKLMFGLINHADSELLKVKPVADVYMTHAQAQALLSLLRKNLEPTTP